MSTGILRLTLLAPFLHVAFTVSTLDLLEAAAQERHPSPVAAGEQRSTATSAASERYTILPTTTKTDCLFDARCTRHASAADAAAHPGVPGSASAHSPNASHTALLAALSKGSYSIRACSLYHLLFHTSAFAAEMSFEYMMDCALAVAICVGVALLIDLTNVYCSSVIPRASPCARRLVPLSLK